MKTKKIPLRTCVVTKDGWYACIVTNGIFNGAATASTVLPETIYNEQGQLTTTAIVHVLHRA